MKKLCSTMLLLRNSVLRVWRRELYAPHREAGKTSKKEEWDPLNRAVNSLARSPSLMSRRFEQRAREQSREAPSSDASRAICRCTASRCVFAVDDILLSSGGGYNQRWRT